MFDFVPLGGTPLRSSTPRLGLEEVDTERQTLRACDSESPMTSIGACRRSVNNCNQFTLRKCKLAGLIQNCWSYRHGVIDHDASRASRFQNLNTLRSSEKYLHGI